MKVTTVSKKGLNYKLKVFVDKKIINEKIDSKFTEIKNKVSLKGFRPGKVPIHILKVQFGKSVYQEVLQQMLQETSSKALDEKKIKIIGQPKIDLKIYGENKDLEYFLEAEEMPKISIKGIENIKLTEYELKISSSDVNNKLEEISKNQNSYKDRNKNDVSREGDLVVFDYSATVNEKSFEGNEGKNVQLVLGKDLFIKGFDKQLYGVKKDKEKKIKITLPENYPKKELSNKKAIFKCKILNIKKPEKIVLDDNFSKNLGAKNLDDLKEMVKKQIISQYQSSLDSKTKEDILDQIEKLDNIELPQNLIEQEVLLISKNLKDEEKEKNKNDYEKIAKRRIKIGLILNEFGKKNNIKVNEEEIKSEIQKHTQTMPDQAKKIIEFYKKNNTAIENLRGSIYENKIIDLIKNKNKPQKKIVTIVDAEKILANTYEQKTQKKAKKLKIVNKKKRTTTSSKKNK